MHEHVKENGPFEPIGQLKLSIQYDYNKRKWGLDMCTEHYLKICIKARLSLEGKYVLRLFDGLVGNAWKCEQARIIVSWLREFKEKNDGLLPSLKQLRSKANELSLADYLHNVSIEWLKSLEVERINLAFAEEARLRNEFIVRHFPQASPRRRGRATINASEEAVLNTIADMRQKNKWPITMNKAKTFAPSAQLKLVRTFSSNVITHTADKIEKSTKNKSGLKVCAMCSSKKETRHVRHYCCICAVPLCVKKNAESETSCWTAWHQAEDLAPENKRCQNALLVLREQGRAARAAKRRRDAADLIAEGDMLNAEGDMLNAEGDIDEDSTLRSPPRSIPRRTGNISEDAPVRLPIESIPRSGEENIDEMVRGLDINDMEDSDVNDMIGV